MINNKSGTDERFLEVYRALRDGQSKYVYFLLAAAGATIGLAIQQTQAARLAWSQLPVAGAVFMWGWSFFCGCRHLAYVNSTTYANATLLQVQAGEHPEIGQHPQLIAAAGAGILEAMEYNSERANRLAHWQFRLLVLGAMLYIAWHVYGMYLRTVAR